MQMKKQMKRLGNPRTHVVNLKAFNPVINPKFEIVAFTTLPNLMGPTHGVITTQRKAAP